MKKMFLCMLLLSLSMTLAFAEGDIPNPDDAQTVKKVPLRKMKKATQLKAAKKQELKKVKKLKMAKKNKFDGLANGQDVECANGLHKEYDSCGKMHCLKEGVTLATCPVPAEGQGVPMCPRTPPCKN